MKRTIRIFASILLLLLASVPLLAQDGGQRELVGYVRDEQGGPLVGVVVHIGETDIFAVTDANGRFALRGQWEADAPVHFSFIGFTPVTMPASSIRGQAIRMEPDTQEIGEVVVRAKTNINAIDLRGVAGQVQSMDLPRIQKKPMIDFGLSIQGQVPGLVVTNSGELGSQPQIRIRGNSSFRRGNAINEPLYVMDGQVISAEAFYNLNPEDIKDVKVLKDAAACALYGVKAANGVIEVTSQRGYQGRTVVSYSMNVGLTTRGRRGVRMMKTAEKLELERLLQNDAAPGYLYSEDYLRRYHSGDADLEQQIADGAAKLDSLRQIDTDWFRELLRNNVYHRHNISVKGGGEQATYYISANYSYQGGRIEGNDKRRMGMRMNIDLRAGKIGYVMLSLDGSYGRTRTPNGTTNDPTSLIYNLNPYETKTGQLWSYPGQTYDDLMHQYEAQSDDKGAGASASLTLTPIEGLDIAGVAGLDFSLAEGTQFTPSTAYSEQRSGYTEIQRGIYSKYKNTLTNITTNLRVTWNHTFDDTHDLTLGANTDYYTTSSDNAQLTGYGVGTINSAAAINQSLSGTRQPQVSAPRDKNAQIGFGFVAGYTYDATYDIYATYKRDGSSILPRDKRWNVAWAVGLGWTPTRYWFLADNKVLTRLNVKASYGVTANLNGVSTSSTVATFRYSTTSYENQRPLEFMQLYNRDLVPEQNKNLDFGITAELWKRLTIDASWYNRRTDDALLDVPIPSSTGYTSLVRNIGVLQNRGVELSLNARIVETFDWRLTLGANLAYNSNKVVDLYYTDRIYASEESLVPDYEVGRSYDMLFGPESLGINPLTGYPVFKTPTGEKQATEQLTKDDVVALGHLTPPYTGGVSLSVSYKAFDLDCDLYYTLGGVHRFNYTYVRNRDNANRNAVSGQTEKMWFRVGDEGKTYWTPFYTSVTAEENIALYPNSRTVGKSDYLKLSMVSLRYRVDSRWMERHLPFISFATLGFQGSNLFTWTRYDESDPESGQLAGATQPVFTFNMNITF